MPKAKPQDSLIEEAGQGHNSFDKTALVSLLENIERLQEERKNLNADIKNCFDVGADKGLDKRTMKEMLKARALDMETRRQREDLRDLYLSALGLI